MGREDGCKAFARAFYGLVAEDRELRPLFPGKSLRCATEEFAAFLIQFFEGDEAQTQFRWRLSLRESHARVRITGAQKAAWLRCMHATTDASISDTTERIAVHEFFEHAASHVAGAEEPPLGAGELQCRWSRQLSLDELAADLANGLNEDAIVLAEQHRSRRSVFTGILARMMEIGREVLVDFVLEAIERDPELAGSRYNGRYLVHFAAGAGCLPVLRILLARCVNPDLLDSGGYTPLYRVANECGAPVGAEIVGELVRAGAEVDLRGGVTKSSALHAAARRGHMFVARALLELGASTDLRDIKGHTPLDRAKNCRRHEVAALLASR